MKIILNGKEFAATKIRGNGDSYTFIGPRKSEYSITRMYSLDEDSHKGYYVRNERTRTDVGYFRRSPSGKIFTAWA